MYISLHASDGTGRLVIVPLRAVRRHESPPDTAGIEICAVWHSTSKERVRERVRSLEAGIIVSIGSGFCLGGLDDVARQGMVWSAYTSF